MPLTFVIFVIREFSIKLERLKRILNWYPYRNFYSISQKMTCTKILLRFPRNIQCLTLSPFKLLLTDGPTRKKNCLHLFCSLNEIKQNAENKRTRVRKVNLAIEWWRTWEMIQKLVSGTLASIIGNHTLPANTMIECSIDTNSRHTGTTINSSLSLMDVCRSSSPETCS